MAADPAAAHNGPMTSNVRTPQLLLVEDDVRLVEMLTRLLTGEDYHVDVAADGHRGLHLGLTRDYDVIVVDRGLPAIDGLDLLSRLRVKGIATPVLVLSALGNPADRVAGLDAGAEDYLAKPFDIDELFARLRALRRRHLDTAHRLAVPHGTLDLDTRHVAVAGRPLVRLSARECTLLATLAAHPSQVFSRDDLRALVFDDAGVEVVETYVHYLRRKLGRGIVETVRGRGYQLGTSR
jgi:two-component system response regulator QseB